MVRVSEKVQEAGLILGALGVIGFIGVVFLMIYGNLSTNLGFQQTSASFTNETILLITTGNTPAGVVGKVDVSLSSVLITNATSGVTVGATNYTISGALINATDTDVAYNNSNVNVSYIGTFNSDSEVAAEGVIANLSGGFGTFFGFSNTLFTIAAIVLLVFMLLGLLALVMSIMQDFGKRKSSGGFSA